MKKKKGKTGWMALKIDMEKVYDHLECVFIEKVLHCFGFPDTWIQWVMLVSTTSFSILINGRPFGLARDLTPITYLQFADDLFIFAQVNEENLQRIKYCLDVFSSWSGQMINFFKSIIVYSRNTPHYLKSRLANSIGINALNKKEKYLGIPIAFGRDKKAATEEIIEKVKQRLQGWKMKTLSQAS